MLRCRAEHDLVLPSGTIIPKGHIWSVTRKRWKELRERFGAAVVLVEPDGRSQRDRFLRSQDSVVK